LCRGQKSLVAELDVPVGDVNEVSPRFVAGFGKCGLECGTPLGAFWFANEAHTGLFWGAVAFAGVAGDAGADDVFPCHFSALFAGDDVVEVELGAIEFVAAVLAGVFVAFVNVLTGEFDFAFGNAVVDEKEDDFGDANAEGDGLDNVIAGVVGGEVVP